MLHRQANWLRDKRCLHNDSDDNSNINPNSVGIGPVSSLDPENRNRQNEILHVGKQNAERQHFLVLHLRNHNDVSCVINPNSVGIVPVNRLSPTLQRKRMSQLHPRKEMILAYARLSIAPYTHIATSTPIASSNQFRWVLYLSTRSQLH